MNTKPNQPNKSLKDSLFKRIEDEGVCPRSRLFFKGRECGVWLLWLLSVLVGALAIAVSLFVLLHSQYALYEATHSNFLTFVVDVLPYLWIIVFGLMVFVAMYNLRHTKHGYRYPLWVIVGSSMVLSLAGGSALQLFGLGHTIDRVLGEHMAMYMSQEKFEERLWQTPAEGRLLGKQVHSTLAPTTTVIFEDTRGVRWQLNVTELPSRDLALLASERTVRLLGKVSDGEMRLFHACGAFPWMLKPGVSLSEMSAERQAFVKRVYEYARDAKERLRLLEDETYASSSLPQPSVCANLSVVHRMPIRPENSLD